MVVNWRRFPRKLLMSLRIGGLSARQWGASRSAWPFPRHRIGPIGARTVATACRRAMSRLRGRTTRVMWSITPRSSLWWGHGVSATITTWRRG